MAVNWGLAGQSYNPLEALQAYGQAQHQQMQMADMQRRQAEQAQQAQQAQAKQVMLQSAYSPQTGVIDPVQARQAYLSGGDVEGAMKFDATQAKTKVDTIESQLKQMQATTSLLSSATNPAAYAAARGQAQQMGLDVSSVPEQFDPQWVQQAAMASLDAKDRLAAELAREKLRLDTEAKARNDARQDRVANNSIATSNARLGLARETRAEGRVRFKERDKDRAALAASGGIRTDTSDLDY